ncbi:MAG: OmpA family protein [Bacteroidaceae bacterium]|nr:OmpA family protein [Bacteroidaceae bacterium]
MRKYIPLLMLAISMPMAAQTTYQDQLNAKDREIAELKKQLAIKQAKQKLLTAPNLMPSVLFTKNSSVINDSQMASIEMLAKYAKKNTASVIEVRAFASNDEENADLLCKKRAETVISVLSTKYKVPVHQLNAAPYGATAVLYDVTEYNRVVLFNDNKK